MNTSMDILGVKYEFDPSVFYLFGPSVKNLVLRFSIYSVLRIRITVPARKIGIIGGFFIELLKFCHILENLQNSKCVID